MKPTSNPSVGPKIDLSKLSEEQLSVLMTNAQKALKDATDRKAASHAEQERVNKMASAVMDSFHTSLGKALGAPNMTAKDALAHYSTYLGAPSPTSTLKGKRPARSRAKGPNATVQDKGKRLTEDQRNAIRTDMLQRRVDLKLNKVPQTIQSIANKHGVTPQTADSYKPTDKQVQARINELMAAVAAAAAVPASTPAVEAPVQAAV